MAVPRDARKAGEDSLLKIAEPIAPLLLEVEEGLQRLVPPEVGGRVPQVYQYIVESGGKRLRPILALLSCGAAGGNPAAAVDLAVYVEALHLASLVHDDVVDEAEFRRGQPSVRQKWGNRIAVLMGDFLVAEIFRLLADELGLRALTVLAGTVTRMAQAELRHDAVGDTTEDEYYAGIQGKTAALMASACEVGGIAAENREASVHLRAYGDSLGEAFQITDDLLDLYGDPALTGKPIYQDLQEGCITLPLVHALGTGSDRVPELRELICQAASNPLAARRAAELAERLGGREYAEKAARDAADEAIRNLTALPESDSRRRLQAIAQYAITRQR